MAGVCYNKCMRFVVLAVGFSLAAVLRPIIGYDGLSMIGASLMALFCVFCVGHRLIAGRWPEFS